MMWFKTFVFLIFNMIYMLIFFSVYAKILMKLGPNNNFFKSVFSFVLYLIFAVVLLLPLFNIKFFLNDFYYYVDNYKFFLYVSGLFYLFTCIFVIYYFNKKYITKLQKIGYFK